MEQIGKPMEKEMGLSLEGFPIFILIFYFDENINWKSRLKHRRTFTPFANKGIVRAAIKNGKAIVVKSFESGAC